MNRTWVWKRDIHIPWCGLPSVALKMYVALTLAQWPDFHAEQRPASHWCLHWRRIFLLQCRLFRTLAQMETLKQTSLPSVKLDDRSYFRSFLATAMP